MSVLPYPVKAPRTGRKIFLTAHQVRERYGGISDMSIWRWLRDPALNFPQPIRIKRVRFWDEANLDRFDEERRAAG